MKNNLIFSIILAFAAVLLITVDDAFADHETSLKIATSDFQGVCGPSIGNDCRSIPIMSGENIWFDLHTTGVYNPLDIIRVWIDKNNVNSSTEVFAEFGNEGGYQNGITVSKNGEGSYRITIHTGNLEDGTHSVTIESIQNRNGSNRTLGGGDGYQFTIGALTQDVLKPVITIPELTTDQWGNENLELSMSGTTNFPTGSWTLDVTDNVDVADSACWFSNNVGGNYDPGDPWDSNTQSYDFSKITNPPSGQKFAIGSTSINCAAYDAAGNRSETYFQVVVTHDDPTGFVQYVDKPNSFGNTADSTTKIFYSANSAQSLHLLKPIADLLTTSNTQGMLARDAEWTLLNGELEFDDLPNNFYTLMKKCYPSGGGQGCSEYQIPKPIATMLTDANMAGMWERTDPDRTWNVGDVTVTISDPDVSNWSTGSFNSEIQMCSTSPGGGTSCQGGSVLKPFSHLITESTLNQAMYERSNMKILDAGGPAASSPQSSSSADTTPYITVPDDITITTSDIVEFTNSTGTYSGAIAWNGGDVIFNNVQTPTSYLGGPNAGNPNSGDGCYGNFSPQGWLNGPVTFPIGTTTVTCGAVYDGVEHTETFTVTVRQAIIHATDVRPGSSYDQSCVEEGCWMPHIINAELGDTIEFQNDLDMIGTSEDAGAMHTAISGSPSDAVVGSEFNSGILAEGDRFRWTPTEDGVYPFYCGLHPWMTGTIIVGDVIPTTQSTPVTTTTNSTSATTTTPAATPTTPAATPTTPAATPTTPSTPTDNSITVKTNRETFTQGNPIVVFGKVSQTVNDDVISLKISKDGNVIHNQDFKPTTKGDYTKLVTTKGNMWNDSGNYRIDVSYDGTSSLTNFFLTSNPSVSTNSTATTPTNSTSSTPSTNNQDASTTETNLQNELKISLNKQNFKIGETITIRASLDSVVSEQNVAVSVIDPNNKNVVSRTITVENSDQSSLQFKLVDNSISGTYVVKITSLINGQTISDSTEFTVVSSNSGVEIVSIEPTDQQGNPVTTFTKNKMGFVKVVLSAENPINSLVTVNLFDSEFTSLGVGSFKTQLSGEHEIILSFFTPEFATIGNGEIYANVFSEWPSAGGIPLTGESSSQVILK